MHAFVENSSVVGRLRRKFSAYFGVNRRLAPKISAHFGVNKPAPKFRLDPVLPAVFVCCQSSKQTKNHHRQFSSRWISNQGLIFWGAPISPKLIPQTKSDTLNTNLNSEVWYSQRIHRIQASKVSSLVSRGVPIWPKITS